MQLAFVCVGSMPIRRVLSFFFVISKLSLADLAGHDAGDCWTVHVQSGHRCGENSTRFLSSFFVFLKRRI
jgi:hypothetical protein